MPTTLSVVVPAYREALSLPDFLTRLAAVLTQTQETFEVIVVDDGSPDDTWDVLQREAANRPYLRALRLSRNFGKEAALAAGLHEAKGRAVVTIDADSQHPPELVTEMLRLWHDGAQVVEAVRSERTDLGFVRRAANHLFYGVLRRLSGCDLEASCDFKLLDAAVIAAWREMGEYGLFFRGMVAWLGFSRAAVPFAVAPRLAGQSGWSSSRLIKLGLHAITAFSAVPLRLITLMGVSMFGLFVVVGAKATYDWIIGQAVSGFTTVILLLLIIGSGLFVSLGIIGEYVEQIYNEVKHRPRYIVAERLRD